MYLIFSSEEAAWNRSEQEGISIGLAYHTQGKGSRYVTAPQETVDGMWALNVDDYDWSVVEALVAFRSDPLLKMLREAVPPLRAN